MTAKKKKLSAHEWGCKHGSCADALKWRISLGPKATQSDAWKKCQRSDWLLWQYRKLPMKLQEKYRPKLQRAVDKIADRAVRKYALKCKIASVAAWAKKWLSGEDRTYASASAAYDAADAAYAAATRAATHAATDAATAAATAAAYAAAAASAASAAYAAERRQQARDIHREIPEWPGKD